MSALSTNLLDPIANCKTEKGKLIIYGSSTSRVRKVLWAAAEAGLEVERVDILASQIKEHKWFADMNPKLTIPCMRDGDFILNESNTIVSYICQVYGKHLYPDSPEQLALAWQWLEYGESTVVPTVAPLWFGITKNMTYPAKTCPANQDQINECVPKCAKAWQGVEDHLKKDERKYILGDSFTMADITLGIQADRMKKNNGFGFKELNFERFPNVSRWLKNLESRSAFIKHGDEAR